MKGRLLALSMLIACAAALGSGCGSNNKTSSVSPEAAAGAHAYVTYACGECHGQRGRGGVSPYVPALMVVRKASRPRA